MNIKGTTRAQTLFLRALHKNPAGIPPELWPSPAILRRWLRRYEFRHSLLRIRDTLTFQADFNLAAAASQAALRLSGFANGKGEGNDNGDGATADIGDKPSAPVLSHHDLRALVHLLRQAHIQRRFGVNPERDLDLHRPASFELRDYLREQRGEDPDNDPDPLEPLIEQMLKQNPGSQLTGGAPANHGGIK